MDEGDIEENMKGVLSRISDKLGLTIEESFETMSIFSQSLKEFGFIIVAKVETKEKGDMNVH